MSLSSLKGSTCPSSPLPAPGPPGPGSALRSCPESSTRSEPRARSTCRTPHHATPATQQVTGTAASYTTSRERRVRSASNAPAALSAERSAAQAWDAASHRGARGEAQRQVQAATAQVLVQVVEGAAPEADGVRVGGLELEHQRQHHGLQHAAGRRGGAGEGCGGGGWGHRGVGDDGGGCERTCWGAHRTARRGDTLDCSHSPSSSTRSRVTSLLATCAAVDGWPRLSMYTCAPARVCCPAGP
jgi:hypothetical protein